MAMSLEDLLSKEGFKRGKAKIRPPMSVASEGRGTGAFLSAKKTQRTRSHIPRSDSTAEFSPRTSVTGRKPNPITLRQRNGHRDSMDANRLSIRSTQDLQGSEITEVVPSDNEIVEVGVNRPYKDIYSNKVYGRAGNGSANSTKYEGRPSTDDKRSKIRSSGYSPPQEHRISSNDNRRRMKQPQLSYRLLPEGDKKYDDENRGIRQAKGVHVQAFEMPALDEVAVKAVISILCTYVKRFTEDEEFRTSLRDNSFALLDVVALDEGLNRKSKVIENLVQAIEIVEGAAEDGATSKELKRASLQLSVITGLNNNDAKSEFTSGIQNYKLSSCAHLYLSVIYVLQKKDAAAAKHLLQVFCDLPFQARTALLPDLWDHLFVPHLSHLQLWYDNKTRSLADSLTLANARVLEKVYNESLDSGTYQVATYYRDWITKGIDAPSIPLIKIPIISGEGAHGRLPNPANHASPKPMVSKKLYDEVFFKHSHKSEDAMNPYKEENVESSTTRSADSPAPVDKQLIVYSGNSATCATQKFVTEEESPNGNVPTEEEARRLHPESSSGLVNLKKNEDLKWHQRNSCTPHVQEEPRNYDDFGGKSSLCSIPNDFLCPLTGRLFKDPVTLETGQTYEREAIVDWLGQGLLTCPVTRKPLQCRMVPPTNLILQRIIDAWKVDHFKHLFALFSQMAADCNEGIRVDDSMIICVLEQLLMVFDKDEKITNAQRMISLGGVQFLLRRFQLGNTQEKTLILQLLSCCIEADTGCRNYIAGKINLSNLLELLHSEQPTLRTNTVLLLTQLICSNRRVQTNRLLDSLPEEVIGNAMDDLVIYLQICPPEQMPLVAILLLHLSILSETQSTDIFRQDAVEALTISMERSLTDEKFWSKCSGALLILGGCFSSSGKLMTEDWMLKLAGFLSGPDWDTAENEANGTTDPNPAPVSSAVGTDVAVEIFFDLISYTEKREPLKVDSWIDDGDEENAREKWLVRLSASLLENGKKSFLDSVSKCLSYGNSDMVRVCLTTVAWLSSSLASLPDTEIQLCAFSALISPLKQCLETGELVEHKILASLSLLNFSKIKECKDLLMKFAKEIRSSLEDLAVDTWTAKELLQTIISRDLEENWKTV